MRRGLAKPTGMLGLLELSAVCRSRPSAAFPALPAHGSGLGWQGCSGCKQYIGGDENEDAAEEQYHWRPCYSTCASTCGVQRVHKCMQAHARWPPKPAHLAHTRMPLNASSTQAHSHACSPCTQIQQWSAIIQRGSQREAAETLRASVDLAQAVLSVVDKSKDKLKDSPNPSSNSSSEGRGTVGLVSFRSSSSSIGSKGGEEAGAARAVGISSRDDARSTPDQELQVPEGFSGATMLVRARNECAHIHYVCERARVCARMCALLVLVHGYRKGGGVVRHQACHWCVRRCWPTLAAAPPHTPQASVRACSIVHKSCDPALKLPLVVRMCCGQGQRHGEVAQLVDFMAGLPEQLEARERLLQQQVCRTAGLQSAKRCRLAKGKALPAYKG